MACACALQAKFEEAHHGNAFVGSDRVWPNPADGVTDGAVVSRVVTGNTGQLARTENAIAPEG